VGELVHMWLDLYASRRCQRRALHIARVPANPNCSGVVGSSTLPMIGRMRWISFGPVGRDRNSGHGFAIDIEHISATHSHCAHSSYA